MNVSELIELSDKAYEILGWNGGGSIDLGHNVEEVGDLVMYCEVHDSVMVKTSDLLEAFETLKAHLEAVFGKYAAGFDFFEDEKSQSGYSVAIRMAHFSTNTSEEVSKGT